MSRSLAVALAVAGCAKTPLPHLEVDPAGCDEVWRGPVCGVSQERTLRLWIEHPAEENAELRVDGEIVEAQREPTSSGFLYRIEVPPAARQVQARCGGTSAWSMPLRSITRNPALDEAARLMATGAADRAVEVLRRAQGALGPADSLRVQGALGRIALAQGRHARASHLLRQTYRRWLELGCLSCSVEDGLVLGYVLVKRQRDFDSARELLDEIGSLGPVSPETSMYRLHLSGLLSRDRGDLRAAIHSMRESRDTAVRIGDREHRRAAQTTLAGMLQAIGQRQRASELLEDEMRLEMSDTGSCLRAEILCDVGWAHLLESEASRQPPQEDRAGTLLKQAWSLYPDECSDPTVAGIVAVNLAHNSLHRGAPDEARAYLQQARQLGPPTPGTRLWILDLDGRLALAGGDPDRSRAAFLELQHLAEQWDDTNAQWRARAGLARSALRRGDLEEAMRALASAELLLEEAARRVALGDGRDAFLGARAQVTETYLSLLAEEQPEEAMRVARRSRARAIQSLAHLDRIESLPATQRKRWNAAVASYRSGRAALEQQVSEDWQLSNAELARVAAKRREARQTLRRHLDDAFAALGASTGKLRAPAEGELFLVVHPIDDRWLALVGTTAEVRAIRLGAGDELGRRIVQTLANDLRSAASLHVIAAGDAATIDFHALELDGAPLLEQLEITYGLDLPGEPTSTTATNDAVLIVADPNEDLPHTRRELEQVVESIGPDRPVRALVGARATAAAVRDALPTVGWLHFAGHSRFAGWDSALILASQTQLATPDLLALRRTPRVVVLAGCETGRQQQSGPVAGVGLANAFAASGSRVIVAATRRIPDDVSARLIGALYRTYQARGSTVAAALRSAQLEIARSTPEVDWPAFRVFVP